MAGHMVVSLEHKNISFHDIAEKQIYNFKNHVIICDAYYVLDVLTFGPRLKIIATPALQRERRSGIIYQHFQSGVRLRVRGYFKLPAVENVYN